jgi:hypothetical protein
MGAGLLLSAFQVFRGTAGFKRNYEQRRIPGGDFWEVFFNESFDKKVIGGHFSSVV